MHHVEFKLDNNETIHLKIHQVNHFKRAEGQKGGIARGHPLNWINKKKAIHNSESIDGCKDGINLKD